MNSQIESMARLRFGQTARRDLWWGQTLSVFVVLSAFATYATWAAFQGKNYYWGPYLSPFYAPEIWGESPNAWFGPKPLWWPHWMVWSPALIILIFPLGFRLTCYYYRGAYYKSFWADPPSCSVGEPRHQYWGEATWPLIVQNIHRYFLYPALLFIVFLSYEVWKGLWFTNPADGSKVFGIGVGTLVLAINVVLLGGYTLGCHSLRHLVGGRIDRLSQTPLRREAYRCASCLNRGHMPWAWASLFWVAFSDLYVRMCAMGVWTDWRLF
jgi:hypothetical protein